MYQPTIGPFFLGLYTNEWEIHVPPFLVMSETPDWSGYSDQSHREESERGLDHMPFPVPCLDPNAWLLHANPPTPCR
jgi:hypothetical protein